MKKTLLLIFATLLPLMASAETDPVNIGGVWYNLFLETQEAEVTYSTDYTTEGQYAGDIIVPSTVTHGGVTYTVTRVGNSAFFGNPITTVQLPECVTSIEKYAFENCQGLTAVNIPKKLKTLGDYAFENCPSLTSLTLPEGLKTIGNCCFMRCHALEHLNIPESVDSLGYDVFQGCAFTTISLPKGLKWMEGGLFAGCEKLESVTLPDSVEYFGPKMFSGCHSLTSVKLPKGFSRIPDWAFEWCESLESIDIPEGVTSVGWWAFKNCTNLTTIILPKGLESIEDKAFAYCTALKDVYCYAEKRPEAEGHAFVESYEGATLHVPEELIPYYRSKTVWNSVPEIVPLVPVGISEAPLAGEKIESIYDLSGRRHGATSLDYLPKGIYIINGQKVIK